MPTVETYRDRLITEIRSFNGSDLPFTEQVVIVDDFRRDWQRTPNFKSLRKTGSWIPPRPFVFGSMSGGYGTISSYFPPDENGRFGAMAFTSSPTSVTVPFVSMPTSAIDDSELYSKALQRVAGAKFQAPVAFLEGHKTASMIGNRVIGLGSAVRLLRRGNLPAAFRALNLPTPSLSKQGRFHKGFGLDARKAAGDAWLELQYGWLPFLSDIKSAAELLADVVVRERNRIGTIRARSKRAVVSNGTTGFIPIAGPVTDNRLVLIDGSTRTQYEKNIVFHYEVDGEVTRTLSQLSLSNPLEVAWELVPFSFVVDWMLPVGNYLSNMSALHGVTPRGYTLGDRIRSTSTFGNARYHSSSDPFGRGVVSCDVRDQYRVWASRREFAGAPPNSFPTSVSFPFATGSSVRLTNAIALLSQQLSRLKR